MSKTDLEQIVGGIIAIVVLVAVASTLWAELETSSLINSGILTIVLLVAFIAFLVQVIRRIGHWF